ncbi:hypothetical protein [Microbacterium natoriense]
MSDPTGRVPLAFALWIAQLFLTVLGAGHTFLSALSIASCTATSCDYAAFAASMKSFYVGAVILLVLTAAAIFLLRHRPVVVLAPIVGIVLLILMLAITYAAGRAALTLPLFGDRLA